MPPHPSATNQSAKAPAGPLSLSEHMQRGALFAVDCPSREVLQHVTSRWGVLLLVALMGGSHRFSDLRRKVGGVSEKMLAQTLRWLEADGFVLRDVKATVPPHVEYRLTPLGREVGERVQALADWIECAMPQIMAVRQAREAALPAEPAGVHRIR
ncbi:HxlR family transcriptional regulator [Hydrogenophaga crassostreae]|uniref:Transcriptional regulator n=1 Tax=Hydrogenophaga crassostreae TaxID=1763535 RepID=A0A162P1H5_9BURK|nr:helix-turn-helix domain-containing protein [Hydrogenophaga crassostreae]AOW13033.1 transcriptional regulator [Hydrogenophaga crassostreae]OAD40217.1 HxlR family transcriptional regulator [Hydrogenophaga crassostreae]